MNRKKSVLTSEATTGFTGFWIHSRCQVSADCESSCVREKYFGTFRRASSNILHREKNCSQTSIHIQSVDR